MTNILFITANSIGDSVLSTGVLALLRRDWPEARITVVCGPAPASLFRAMPMVTEVIAMPKKRYGIHWFNLWVGCLWRRWRLVVDLRGSLISWFLPTVSRRVFFNRRSRVDDAHVVTQFSHFMGYSEPVAPLIEVTPAFHAFARQHIPDDRRVIALGPIANWFGKQWPIENYAALMDRLTGHDGLFPHVGVAIFGGPGERDEALPLIEAIPTNQCIDLVGRIDLAQTYACLKRCCFYIGNDSGLMHMAAAAGIPTLGLFGPTNAKNYHPWGQHTAITHTNKSQKDLPTPYDFNNSGRLMYGLSIGQVEQAAFDLWQQAHMEKNHG